ncbi:T9SS type A sorting domain-containing protein [bacterium]|nr:T9SS type A sorting domain-containing protein [bacterium]
MVQKLLHVALLAVLLNLQPLLSQPAPFGFYDNAEFSPDFELLEFSESTLLFRLSMTRLQPTGTIDFFQKLPGTWADLNYNGHQVMPRFTFYLALPNTGNPTVTVLDWQTISRPTIPRVIPENTGSPVRLGEVGIFAGVRLVPVTVKPFTYVNNQSSCLVMSEATIRIDIDGQSGLNPLTSTRLAFSEVSRDVFKSLVANWESIPNIGVTEPSHMLMVIPESYLGTMSDYILWKRQMGIRVTIVPAGEINSDGTGNLLRNRIQQELANSSPRIDYVTLVGDETVIPIRYRYTEDPVTRFSDFSLAGQFTNEGYFSELEGNDVFPDVFLGRWVVNSQAEARSIAVRTVQHERDTFSADSLRFERAAVAADYTEITQRLTKQRAREIMLSSGISHVDTLWGEQNPGPQLLMGWLTEGLSFVNYRGSGWQQGWAGISFYYWSVPQISNAGKLPIVTGIGCGVGKFDAPEAQCFGEVWMLHGTVTTPQGAAGFIGPCWNTHTVYNDCLDTCLYRAMLDYDIRNLMPALTAGKMYSWAVFNEFLGEGPVEEICEVMFRQYLVLSDPSLQLFTDTPVRAMITMPTAIPSGPYQVPVTVNQGPAIESDSLTVSFSTLTGVVHSGRVPSTPGQWYVPVDFDFGEEVTATVTAPNVLARQYPVQVSPSGPYLTHRGLSFSDAAGNGDGRIQPGETIAIIDTMMNIGSDAAFLVHGVLETTQQQITVLSSESDYGTVGSGESSVGSPSYSISVAPEISAASTIVMELTYSANQVAPRSDDIFLTLHMPNLSVGSLSIADGGNGLLERYEVAGLSFRVTNSGNEVLPASSLNLVSSSPYLEVLDATADLPQLSPGQSYQLPENSLRVAAAGNSPSGVQANLSAVVTAEMSTYTFERSLPLTIVIGQVGQGDPLLGSDGLYYMYDDTDVIYDRVAVYDWVEISPSRGGPGTELDFTQSQQTFNVPVPFNYAYFGETYSSLSISTDGWVVPGFTQSVSYANQPLPYAPDFVSGMIGILWNDLWYFFGDTGDVSYFYDDIADRFIVEWRDISDWATGTRPNTFQVQLLNPATYPTPTGDAEWLFMYQDLTLHASAAAGATIGYENMDESQGGTYFFENSRPPTSAPLEDGRAIRLTTAPPTILESEHDRPELPGGFSLRQNYPNPFNPETMIEFTVPHRSDVTLEVFDVLGRRVSHLISGYFEAGTHRIGWNGRNNSGVSVPSGIYFYRLTTPDYIQTRRMLLMR